MKNAIVSILGWLHRPIYRSRISMLVHLITPHLKQGDTVLDVGCGFGILGKEIKDSIHCPMDVDIVGVERVVRSDQYIQVDLYDGEKLPYCDNAFDVVIIADVLHHEANLSQLLRECKRVCKRIVIIKDHKIDGFLAQQRITLLDWIANYPYNIPCLYDYLTKDGWRIVLQKNGLTVRSQKNTMQLYPFVIELLFGGKLHIFIVANSSK